MELNHAVDLEDLKRLSNALEAASELDPSRPLSRFGYRFSAANLVLTKARLTVVTSDEPRHILAKISLFTRFQNAMYGAIRLNNMGLTVTAYSCLREAQEVFDLLRLVNVDHELGQEMLDGKRMTANEIIEQLVPFENTAPECAQRRLKVIMRCEPMGSKIPPVHFELNGNEATVDPGGRRIEEAQKEFNDIGLALFDDCIFEFSGERYADLQKIHRQMMTRIYSGDTLFPG
jgi:hypothetical protein